MKKMIVGMDMPHNEVLKLVKEHPEQMLVKVEKCGVGYYYYCAACGAWLEYDPHSYDCPYESAS